MNFTFLFYLTGPMLFFYIRSLLTDKARLKRIDILHFIPAGIFFINTIPFYLSSWTYKEHIASSLIENVIFLKSFSVSFLYEIIPAPLIYLSRPFLLLFYSLWSFVIFIRYLNNKKYSMVLSHQRYMNRWIWILLSVIIVLTVSHLIPMFLAYMREDLRFYNSFTLLQTISGITLAGLLTLLLFFPGILYGMPRIPDPENSFDDKSDAKDANVINARKTPQFESEYLLLIRRSVDNCMEEFKPFLQPDCNLVYISGLVRIPAHHLAYYFREEKKQSFNSFRNEYRVKYAKSLIINGKAKEMTLEAIGLLSGFKTRKTFIDSFKKVEGISPGAFLNRTEC